MRIAFVPLLSLLCFTAAHADVFGTGENQFEIEFVTIDNPGNAADTSGIPNPAGAVDYVYRIGKYEVGRDMVDKASNVGGLSLTLDPMDFVTGSLGDGPRPSMPATGISWNEAAQFINWLNTSKGFSPAYKFSTQPWDGAEVVINWDGSYVSTNPNGPLRNRDAHYFLPNDDEWYKAAYYSTSVDENTSDYWDFPTGSDVQPTAVGSGTKPNTAVYNQTWEQGPADITQAGGLSSYGAMGMGGNVLEWQETPGQFPFGHSRTLRAGFWMDDASHLSPLVANAEGASVEYSAVGFRVASIPEPSSQLLALMGMLGLLTRRRTTQ